MRVPFCITSFGEMCRSCAAKKHLPVWLARVLLAVVIREHASVDRFWFCKKSSVVSSLELLQYQGDGGRITVRMWNPKNKTPSSLNEVECCNLILLTECSNSRRTVKGRLGQCRTQEKMCQASLVALENSTAPRQPSGFSKTLTFLRLGTQTPR